MSTLHFGINTALIGNYGSWGRADHTGQLDVAPYLELARTAHRGRFDFVFVSARERIVEHLGRISEAETAGRPDPFTLLGLLAQQVPDIGLVVTSNSTYADAYDQAWLFSSLDVVTDGRIAWNVVTSADAWVGENFRSGAYLPYEQRYARAAELLEATAALWAGWDSDHVTFTGPTIQVSAAAPLPRTPQGRPPVVQAGDSPEGRALAGRYAEVVFSPHADLEGGRAHRDEVRRAAVAAGRSADDVLLLPGARFVVADTDAEAREKSDEAVRRSVSPLAALYDAEEAWGRDLSAYSPHGPLPDLNPLSEQESGPVIQGRNHRRLVKDRSAVVEQWRAVAHGKLSIHETAVRLRIARNPHRLVGSPRTIADFILKHHEAGASDGYILYPGLFPGDLDEFVDRVVPLLQEAGRYRSDYGDHANFRDLLGTQAPPR